MDSLQDDILIDDEEVSSSLIVKQLINVWINEKNAPDLLPYALDIVDCMMAQIEQMDENLQNLSRTDFLLVPHQMEVNRLRYILASYHRCRLDKIESFAAFILKRDQAASHDTKVMSAGEYEFAQEFLAHRHNHFHSEALKFIPDILRKGGPNASNPGNTLQMLPDVVPNLKSSVFIEVIKHDLATILVNDSEEVDLPFGSKHIVPYEDIRGLVQEDSVVLI